MTPTTIARSLKDYQPSFVIGSVMVFMLVFSAAFLFGKSLRLDEAQSLWQTSHSIEGVLTIIAQDVHMPLYFLMLRAWETVFGATAFGIRSFSFVFLLACVPLFYALAERAYSRTVAIMTVLLVATSPFLLWYGSEGRMYTLLLFLTVANQLAFLNLWSPKADKAYWLLYAVSAALGAITHYFFFFVLAIQAVFYLTHRHLFQPKALRGFIVTAVIVVAEYLVWWAYRTNVGKINADPFLSAPTSIDVFNVFSSFFLGFQSEALNTIFLSLWPIFVLMAFTLLSRGRTGRPETLYFLMAGLLPIVMAFVISLVLRPLFLPRYLIIALPSLYILVAHFIFVYRQSVAQNIAIAVILFMQIALFVQALSPSIQANEDYRSAASYLEQRVEADDLVVVSAPFTRYPMEHYYDGEARLATFPMWERYLELPAIPPYEEEDLAAATEEWKERYTTLYVLTSYDQGYEESLRLYLDHHVERIDHQAFSPGLNLYVYRLRYL